MKNLIKLLVMICLAGTAGAEVSEPMIVPATPMVPVIELGKAPVTLPGPRPLPELAQARPASSGPLWMTTEEPPSGGKLLFGALLTGAFIIRRRLGRE